MKGFNTPVISLAVAAILSCVVVLRGQVPNQQPTPSEPPQSHSVWDGVFVEKQAQRGQALYHDKCSSCHGDQLAGQEKDAVPALTGRDFEVQWDGRTVGDMFKKILRKMPQDDPGTLTPQQTADLVAFVLSFNKFPAGKTELPPDSDTLATIHFDPKKPDQKNNSSQPQ